MRGERLRLAGRLMVSWVGCVVAVVLVATVAGCACCEGWDPLPPCFGRIQLDTDAVSLDVGGDAQLTAQLMDLTDDGAWADDPIEGVEVQFSAWPDGLVTFSPATAATDSSGTVTTTLRGDAAGVVLVRAETWKQAKSEPLEVTVSAADASKEGTG